MEGSLLGSMVAIGGIIDGNKHFSQRPRIGQSVIRADLDQRQEGG
jgi:hypothetical protein